MNKIYKVIWSKAKHTYVVASEIAKGHTKGETTGKGLKKLAAAMLVAAALLSPSFAWAADTVTVTDTDGNKQTVYTEEGAKNNFATINNLSEVSTEVRTQATDINTNATNINGLTTRVTALETADKNSVTEVTGSDAKLTITKGNGSTSEVTIDNVNHATSADSATTAESATKATQDGNGNEISTTYATKTEVKGADEKLDSRITAVKEFLQTETEKRYVSKDSLASELEVKAAGVVKEDQTIGENVSALGKALYDETNARIWADKTQDKVIQQVNQNMVDGFNTINKNMSDGFTALNQADAALDDKITAETAGRVAADTKLVKAMNSGLSLSEDNVLQKDTTTIDAQGNVTPSKTDANEMILNKDNDNRITMNENGIKVGKNSMVMDKDGVYTGGDTYSEAKAAMSADGSIKGAGGDFIVDGTNGNVNTKGSVTAASGTIGNVSMSADGTVTGVKDLTASGKVTADSFTDGTATMSNGSLNGVNQINATGNIVTTGDMQAHDMTATGTITGQNINGTSGTFGSLTTTGNASVGGTLTANGINNTGNTTTDSLTVKQGATVGGNLAVTGDITGKSLNVGTGDIKGGQITGTGLDVGAGTIKTTGAVETGTLTISGNADIGGNLTVDKNLTVNGEFNAKTLSSKLDENNYTTINGGNVTSVNVKVDTDAGRTYTSSSKLTEKGRTDTAGDGTTLNKSTQTASESGSTISSLADEKQKSYITQNLKKILQGIQNGDNATTVNQTETGIKSTATDGKNTASTNLSNKGFNTYATDGTNKTYTKQTATDIKNTAENGTISNSAKDLVNTATGDITNTAKNGTITNEAKDLVNKASGDMTNTVGGKLLNDVTGDMENKVGGNLTTTVTGDVTEDYKANLSTTVGGNQTTTVTGDSSLTAENIKNEAKNRITNTALDVETDASSSIVNKVSNDAGSNTSTQLSYQTTEEMSADGKTASYLRGAAEEKSQLTDGDNKTTIDTVAGQTNTNITDGTNTSNNLQKADQVASSVTDGTNTTVVNQDAKSLASSITDGAKVNNTNSTVDKSEQLIKVDDTHFYAETKTVDKAEEALKSGTTLIDIVKDTKTATVSSAVTDGKTITGISQNAKDINLSAAGGTIANSAKNISNIAMEKLSNSAAEIENTATKSITDKVGKNTSWEMTDGKVVESVKDESGKTNQTTTTATDTYQFVKDGANTLAKRTSSTNDNLNITDGTNTYTKITNATGNKQTVTDGKETASTNLTKSASNTLIENGTQSVLDHMAADTSYTVMNENGNGSRRQQTASEILDRVTDGTDTSEVKQTASEVAISSKNITNTADTIKDVAGKTTVTTTDSGTTFENTDKKDKVTFMGKEKSVDTKETTISGNTITTGEAVMDYADVMKDLGVRGNATVGGNTTLGTDGSDTLTVNSTSTFKEKVTMEKDLNVKSEVLVNEGDKNQVRINTNGITVGLNSTVVDYEGVYVGGHNFEKAKAGMDKDGRLKAANGNFQVDTEGNVSAVSYTVKDTTIKIDKEGINAGGTKVTGLAAADISHAGSTDAVSGGQLYETNTRVSGLETRMGTVETKVDKLDNKIDKVGANAAAMANLHPLEFDEDSKWNIAAAVGSSGSETASAVGVFYRPNENVMVNASAAMGTGENMFGGGVSLRLGHGGNKAKEAQMKAAAKENRELRAKVDDLTARMDALLSVLNPNMSKDFPDVPENHWAYEAVSRLAGNGIVEGYEDGKYHGERQMTRYEMAEIIYNALSKGAKAEKKLVEEFRPELQAMAAQKRA